MNADVREETSSFLERIAKRCVRRNEDFAACTIPNHDDSDARVGMVVNRFMASTGQRRRRMYSLRTTRTTMRADIGHSETYIKHA